MKILNENKQFSLIGIYRVLVCRTHTALLPEEIIVGFINFYSVYYFKTALKLSYSFLNCLIFLWDVNSIKH